MRSCFTPWSAWTRIAHVTLRTNRTFGACQAYISFRTLRSDGACIALVAFGSLKSNFTTGTLWTHDTRITFVTLRTLWTHQSLRTLWTHGTDITLQTLRTDRADFTAWTLRSLRSGVALQTLWTHGTHVTFIALVTAIPFITFGTGFTAWTLVPAIAFITLVAFIAFGSLHALRTLGSGVAFFTLRAHRTSRTHSTAITLRSLQTHATIVERGKEGHDLLFSSVLQMKEHGTGRPSQKLLRQFDFLAKDSHEVAAVMHHNFMSLSSPQNLFRVFIEDGNFKPVEHGTDVLLARAVAVRFDINIGRTIVIVDGRMGIVLTRIILPRILTGILSGVLPRIFSVLPGIFLAIVRTGIRRAARRGSSFVCFARCGRPTVIGDGLGVRILSLDHNRCRSPFDFFLRNAAAKQQQCEGKSRPGARKVHFHWMFHWSPLL